MKRALLTQASDPQAADRLWSAIDHEITDQAPWMILGNIKAVTFAASRVGDFQYHAEFGPLLDQLWVH